MDNQRPAAIIAICFIWLLAFLYETYAFLLNASGLASWFMIYFVVLAGGWLTSLAGIWMMRKWGVILFTVFFAVNQLVTIIGGTWHLNSIMLPVLIIAVSYAHFNRMR